MASVSIWNSGAPLLKATINWGAGTAVDIQQISYTFNTTTYYNPASATFPGLVAPVDGFITNLTQPNQTFNGSNQNLNIRLLAIGGITSFDTDLTGLSVLTNLTLGGYYQTGGSNGQPNPLINDPISISSFTTILPITTSSHLVSFINNNVDCQTFNPTWNTKSDKLYFYSNQQTTPLTIGGSHRFSLIHIYNNPTLNSITLNNLQYVTDVNSTLGCYLALNGLTQVSINGLNTNTTSTSSDLTIDLSSNKFTTFNPTWISSFPTSKQVNINLASNNISSFDCLFNGLNMNILNLTSQSPSYTTLSTVTDSSLQTSTFKKIYLGNNKISQCPILPTTMTHLYLTGNPIVTTGKIGGLIRPNFSPNMQVFQLSSGGGNLADFTFWDPNSSNASPQNNHTALQNIVTWTDFTITSQGLTFWFYQFNNNITSTTSFLNLQRNAFTTFDMSFVGGFSNIDLSFQSFGNSLTSITNLTTVTKTRILDISVNFKLFNSSSIIPDSNPWPSTLYSLSLYRCTGLVDWTKSLNGFNASNLGTTVINFNATNLTQTSLNYIINDIIKNTNLTNGTLIFSYTNPTGGQYNFPALTLSQVTSDTLACLTCLTTPTSQVCNPTLSSGSNITGMGRGFTVNLRQV